MLTNKIVLILGAGASAPFGFPTGRELIKKIIKIEKEDVPKSTNGLLCPAVLEKLGITNENFMIQLQTALLRSQVDSIDEFLAKPRNGHFSELGRFLIAAFIAPCEHPEKLIELEPEEPNWYRLLRPHLCGYPSIEALREHKHISVVTFNYDRSFEQYFFHMLRSEYGARSTEIFKFFQDSVFHIHGSLGSLDLKEKKSSYLPYRPAKDVDVFIKAMSRIKIMHEVSGLNNESTIRERLEHASKLVFLGCHYHADNVQKLLSLISSKRHPDLKVFGSTFGLTEAECDDARYRVAQSLSLNQDNVHITSAGNMKCHAYIRQFIRFT